MQNTWGEANKWLLAAQGRQHRGLQQRQGQHAAPVQATSSAAELLVVWFTCKEGFTQSGFRQMLGSSHAAKHDHSSLP